jgi:hypothetical protein
MGPSSSGICIAILLVIILIFLYTTPKRVNVTVDNRDWSVVESYDNHTKAAEVLSRVNARMMELLRFLKHKYHIDETDEQIEEEGATHANRIASDHAYTIIETLLTNYNPDVFYENDPSLSSDTSYTMNKGDAMYICLRDKKDPNLLVDEETVLFVMLHECAHIANYNGWGHKEDFWTTFKYLLHEAELAGIYVARNYSTDPVHYCGLDITYNPLLDRSLPNLWEL